MVITNPQIVFYRIEQTVTMNLGQIVFDGERGANTAVFNSLKCWYYGNDYGMVDDFWRIQQAAYAQAEGPGRQ
jgi:hypothetical protein